MRVWPNSFRKRTWRVLLINRWDGKTDARSQCHVLRIIEQLPHLLSQHCIFQSNRKGTHRIIPLIHEVYQELTRGFRPAKCILREVVEHHPPPQDTITEFASTTSHSIVSDHQLLSFGRTPQMALRNPIVDIWKTECETLLDLKEHQFGSIFVKNDVNGKIEDRTREFSNFGKMLTSISE